MNYCIFVVYWLVEMANCASISINFSLCFEFLRKNVNEIINCVDAYDILNDKILTERLFSFHC